MREALIGAALAVSFIGSMQAACLNANADDQVAEGVLRSATFSTPAYNLKEQVYILDLAAPACLDGSDEYDKVDKTTRIHVFSTEAGLRKSLRSLVGKPVRVKGTPFGEMTAHHHAPIVMAISAIERR